MIRITSKVKIAAGLAAGALTLGAAGAYAATANNTITVNNPTPFTLGSGSDSLNLVSLDGSKLTLPSDGFKNAGQCVSWLAKNKQVALAPKGTVGSSLKLTKNYRFELYYWDYAAGIFLISVILALTMGSARTGMS